MGLEESAFALTDLYSNHRVCISTKDKSVKSLLLLVQAYQAQSGVKLKSIRTDNEYHNEPLAGWCVSNCIKLSVCAPHTHQQNPVAENSIKTIKEVTRVNNIHSKTGR